MRFRASITLSFFGWSVGSRHSHVKLVSFLSVIAALVDRAGVRCTIWVRARERAVFDYSGMFPHIIITVKYSNIEIGCVGIGVFVIIVTVGNTTYIGHGNIQYTTLKCVVTSCVVVFETEHL